VLRERREVVDDGPTRDPEAGRDLVLVEPVDVIEPRCRAHVFRRAPEKRSAELRAGDPVFPSTVGGSRRRSDVAAHGDRPALCVAKLVEAHVRGDSVDPPDGGGSIRCGCELPVDAQERFLGGVLGRLRIAEDATAACVDERTIRLVEARAGIAGDAAIAIFTRYRTKARNRDRHAPEWWAAADLISIFDRTERSGEERNLPA
jgi:hypothetical protein